MRSMGPFVPVDDGPGVLAVVGGRGPGAAGRHLRPPAAGGEGPLQAAGGDGRRALRELPARHHGTLGPRSRRPARRARLRAHQRLRTERALRPPARPRPSGHRLRGAPAPHRRPGSAAGTARRDRVGLPHRRFRRVRRGGVALRARCRPGAGWRREWRRRGHRRTLVRVHPAHPRVDAGRVRQVGDRASTRGQPPLALGPPRQLPDGRRLLRVHRRRLRRQLRSPVRRHGPTRPRRTTRASPPWPSAPRAGTRSTGSWPSGPRD